MKKNEVPAWVKMTPLWITPNGITVVRLLFTIPILLLLNSKNLWLNYLGIELYAVAVISDIADGILARGREDMGIKAITRFGELFDPISDKLLQIPVLLLIGLNLKYAYGWIYLVSIMILLDVLLFAIAQIKNFFPISGLKPGSNKWGKSKMGFQAGCILALYYFKPYVDLRIIPPGYDWIVHIAAEGSLLTAIILAIGSIKGHLTPKKINEVKNENTS